MLKGQERKALIREYVIRLKQLELSEMYRAIRSVDGLKDLLHQEMFNVVLDILCEEGYAHKDVLGNFSMSDLPKALKQWRSKS
jgi:hypothetical protein